jgi:glycosyltransferase involved in cell wall biosynthesis/SAM-dependent methyltransferase
LRQRTSAAPASPTSIIVWSPIAILQEQIQLLGTDLQRAVDVVIPCYKHAHLLGTSIESVLAQTHHRVEILVVDDGSPDHPREVVARYPSVRYVYQDNRGLAAARNTGLRESHSPYVVFLDADDRLLPDAVAAGLRCFTAHPECAFVSGGFLRIGLDGVVLGEPVIPQITRDHYLELLRRSYISMHATVMFRREILEAVNGFDESLRVCEDFDLYLRLARSYPVCCHDAVIAEYRGHPSSLSSNSGLMLDTALRVLRSQWPHLKADARHRNAYFVGVRFWKSYYGRELSKQIKGFILHRQLLPAINASASLLRLSPAFAVRKAGRALTLRVSRLAARAAKSVLPEPIQLRLRRLRTPQRGPLPLGVVRLGDFDRVTPISQVFGYDRGLPIDRYYIETFLFRCAADINGQVLEVADNDYTVKFGGNRVMTSDILYLNRHHTRATVIADLTDAPQIPADAFDCIILTQTLHFIYDLNAAVRTLYRILKPGGVLLVTSPGISQIGHDVSGAEWYWALTDASMGRLLREVFPSTNVHVETFGNVFAAVVFLHGLARDEAATDALDYQDPAYPVIVAARAQKPPVAS